MKTHTTIIRWLFLCLTVCFCITAFAAEPPLVLGVFPRHNATETARMFGPFTDYLSRKLGREVRLAMSKDFPSFWKDVTERRFDLVHYNQLHYIRSHEEYGYDAILMNEEYGASTIAGVIVVRKDAGIRHLRDLKGKKIVFGGDEKALVSYVMTKRLLRGAGLRDEDYTEEFARNPPNALLAAYYRQADAAGIGDVVIKFPDIVKHANTAELSVLAKSEPIAHLPWAARKTLAPELRAKIRAILESMKDNAEGRKILEGANLTGLAAASDGDYDAIRKILQQANVKH